MWRLLITSLLWLSLPNLHSAPALIQDLEIDQHTIKVSVNKAFKEEYLTSNFFVTYSDDVKLENLDYSILSMPFIMNVISIVWISGRVYSIKEMDYELYESLKRVKKVFQVMYPKTFWDGELIPEKLVHHPLPFTQDPNKAALLFSGGIDSVSSALAHKNKNLLLITAQGHWDLPLGNTGIWRTRSRRIAEFAATFGHSATTIRSNYTSMLNYKYLSALSCEIPKWRLGAVEGLGWAGLTAPILLAKGRSILHIASSHTWNYPYPTAASPFIDANLRYCGLHVEHDQFDMPRLDKVRFIGQTYGTLSHDRPFLKICSYEKQHDENCMTCRKCLTTALCFTALGIDSRPFGIESSKEIIKKAYTEFSQKKLNYYSILLGKEIQQTIKKRIKNGEQISKTLTTFVTLTLDDAEPFDTAQQKKLCWNELIPLLPKNHSLSLPKGLV